MVVRLDDVAAVVVFLYDAGEYADGLLALGGTAQVFPGHIVCNYHADYNKYQKQQGQRHAVTEHDDEGTKDGADGYDELEQTGLEGLGDLIQVIGDPAEDLAGLILVKEAQGQPVELLGHLGAQLQHQAFCHVGHQIGLEVVEQPGKKIHDGELNELPPHGPEDGKGRSGAPGGLDALPQMVDDYGAVHGVPDAQNHIDDNGYGHDRQTDPLSVKLAEQPDHCAAGILRDFPLGAGQFLVRTHAS